MSPEKIGRCNMMLHLLITVIFIVVAQPIIAQQKVADSNTTGDRVRAAEALLNRRVSIDVAGVSLSQAIDKAATNSRVPVQYQAQMLEVYQAPVTLNMDDVPLRAVLERILEGTTLRVVPDGMKKLIVVEGQPRKQSQSQTTGTISGTVLDSTTKRGVEGATVTLVGSTVVVVTKADGSFRITGVQAGSQTLTVKLLGYHSRNTTVKVEPNKSTTVSITLSQASTTLSEVVTTATGQQRRVEIPSDIVKIDPEKIMERAPVKSLTDLIEAAEVPGVLVQRANGEPGAPSRIRMRGIKTITGGKDPVVIVDGNFIDASVGRPSGIDDIDPATIESVEIVRGPSASTLYGQDAANGVIVITTKKGSAGPTRWRTSYDRNWGRSYGRIPVAYRGFGYAAIGDGYLPCPIAKVVEGACVQDSVFIWDPNHPLAGREGTETTHRIVFGVDGGNATTTYAATATSEQTIGVRRIRPIDQIGYRIMGLQYDPKFETPKTETRRTVNLGVSMRPSQSLTFVFSITGSQTDLTDDQISLSLGSSIQERNLDTLQFLPDGGRRVVKPSESPSRRQNVNLGSSVNWIGPRGWHVSGNAGLSRTIGETSLFRQNVVCIYECVDSTGVVSEGMSGTTNLTARMNVRKQIDLGAFSRVLDLQPSFGGDLRRQESRSMRFVDGPVPAGQMFYAAGALGFLGGSKSAVASAGYYLTVKVGILRRFYFDVGTRNDLGSALSKLGIGGMQYPKLGGSWLVSDEAFWQQTPLGSLMDNFRLRSAIGYSAIQPQAVDIRGKYRLLDQYVEQRMVQVVDFNSAGNPTLKPERAMEVEIGFDLDLRGDWMSMIANYSHTETQNAILQRTLPPSAGVGGTRMENLGRVRNRSFELTTQLRPVNTRNARLELSYTATLQENVVTSLGNITPFSDDAVGVIREGYPIAGVWSRRVLGYRDINGDNLLSPEEVVSGQSVYVGWSQPRYVGGYGVTLSLFGGLKFDTRINTRSRFVTKYTVNNRYGLEDVNAPLEVQADELVASMNNNKSISEVRWNSASLSYYLPKSLLRAMNMRTLSISIRGSNLGLWTNYAGRDPSVNSNLLTSEIASEVGNEIPRPRLFNLSFTLGL